MKALLSITLGVLCAMATPSFATSLYPQPIRPILPIRPIRPILPILPILPIRPILPIEGDSVDVGVIPFVGHGLRTDFLEFDSQHVNHVRLRIPNQCAIQVTSFALRGQNGRTRANLMTTYNDGAYAHFIYTVNGSRGAELNEIEMSLNSMFAYSYQHQCGVRAFLSGNYAIPYNNQ